MATIAEHLRMLRDVQGIYGGCVVAMPGSLVDRDLPEIFDDELFARVGPRISRLYEALASGGKELEACLLRYKEHKLYLRRMNWGIVGFLAAASVNLPAMRMV